MHKAWLLHFCLKNKRLPIAAVFSPTTISYLIYFLLRYWFVLTFLILLWEEAMERLFYWFVSLLQTAFQRPLMGWQQFNLNTWWNKMFKWWPQIELLSKKGPHLYNWITKHQAHAFPDGFISTIYKCQLVLNTDMLSIILLCQMVKTCHKWKHHISFCHWHLLTLLCKYRIGSE